MIFKPRGFIVDRLVAAQVSDYFDMVETRSSANYFCPVRLGELHGHGADSAGCRVDEHGLSRTQLRSVKECLVRGECTDGYRGGAGEIE